MTLSKMCIRDRDNIPGLIIVTVIYVICFVFAVKTSKERANALKEEN